ncbi:Cocaine esterase [Colletotrichum sp. SAR 10_65]|nr:Cocaine esterase [Colletotrichum sp. SAR 10_65]KAI8178498.1 Cocaine esterase [Colletotrichum sp. SAR 10_75]KAI8205957.1 Cocaine esterase [Colletotrichum sp. SAR 10_76]KAI8229168.1 Cocaine esterase [Colletotrichum sp. SAR 10_77]
MSLQIAGFNVEVKPSVPPEHEAAGVYDKFNPSTRKLPKGHRRTVENKAFEADTIFEKDVAMPMRDGIKLYCDVFRPDNAEKVPAILIWSPYGKSGNGMLPGRFGVPMSEVSGYEKFEGLDPATWTARGYAIVNVDLRGTWDSEGITPYQRWLGDQDGKDGYDAVEYIAKLDWCTGKVAFGGNSWLAMVQWVIAAQRPPSLAAIAPWEGNSDFYRDTLCRGGVPYPYDAMWGLLQDTMVGRTGTEAPIPMLEKYPLYNDYWEDKRAKLENIDVPTYVLASYSSALHTTGSIRGYNHISSKDKWLRIHPKQEWSDLYDPENVNDLTKFYDYFVKGKENDWRIPSKSAGTASYDATFSPKNGPLQGDEELFFSYKFTKETWLLGYSWIVLNIANGSEDDIDVFVQLGKSDVSGQQLININVPLEDLVPPAKSPSEVADSCFLKYLGPTGALRGSHAVTKVKNTNKFSGDWPEYTNTSRKAIPAGTVTKLEIPIWPTGMIYGPGESLTLKVSGHYMSYMEFPHLYGSSHRNKGRHTIHFGGDTESYLVLPLTDPISK